MIRSLTHMLLACSATGAAIAHPHKDVDQQVHLAIGASEVIVQVRIAPSFVDGAAIFALIDVDSDGIVSETEASRFGFMVISSATLRLDGARVDLGMPEVSVPTQGSASAGFGLIEVAAVAAIDVADRAAHEIDFEISYGDISHEWFIQPFYFPELTAARTVPIIERSSSGERITVRWSG